VSDYIVELAREHRDGCLAISSEFDPGSFTPGAVVLVATSASPERVAQLWAIHNEWYPGDEEDDDDFADASASAPPSPTRRNSSAGERPTAAGGETP